MSLAWVALSFACFTAYAQSGQSPRRLESGNLAWRGAILGLPEHPGANTTIQDIDRFTENVRLAAPYFSGLNPEEYQANRDLVRRMWAYLAGLELVVRDPQMRLAMDRARSVMGALRFGIPLLGPVEASGQAPPNEQSAAPTSPAEPPYAKLPLDDTVPAGDKATAEELRTRYEMAVARATTAWYSAESLRQSLAARGFTLNAQTASSVGRLQLDFEMAARAMKEHDWAEVRTGLERAEYETAKVLKAVGQ